MNTESQEDVMDVQPEVEEEAQAEAPKAEAQTPSPYAAPTEPLTPSDERTWAMLAHLSVLLNLVTGIFGIAAALIIYLVYKDRSRYVAYQSMQSFLFQLICWAAPGLLIGVIWAVTGALSAILIGILLIPFAVILTVILIILPVIALVYGVVGGIQCSEGQDFRYILVGDWALNLI